MLGRRDYRIFNVRIFDCLPEIVFDDVQITAGGLDGTVPEDLLNDSDVYSSTKDVGGCIVPEGMGMQPMHA